MTILYAFEIRFGASTNVARTLVASTTSLPRVEKDEAGITAISFTTVLRFSIFWTACSAAVRSASVGTSPVNNSKRLYALALTCALSLTASRMRLPAFNSMVWSSSCAPDVRRSVANKAPPAAVPKTSGAHPAKLPINTRPAVQRDAVCINVCFIMIRALQAGRCLPRRPGRVRPSMPWQTVVRFGSQVRAPIHRCLSAAGRPLRPLHR